MGRVVRPRAGDHRRGVADLVHDDLDQPQLLGVVEGGRLAGRAGHDQAVGAVLDEMTREAPRGVLAHGAVGVERRHHRGEDRAKVGGGGHPRRLFHLRRPARFRVG